MASILEYFTFDSEYDDWPTPDHTTA
jgi:hypothetical protein